MGRKVISCNAVVKLIEPFAIPDVQQWVSEKCRTDGYEWLLIHSLEGTLWGRFEQGELKLALPTDASPSDDPVASLLLQENIIQLRLFCADKELFLWRTSDGKLRGRVIEDTEDLKNNRWNLCLDETQLLWGNKQEKIATGYTRLIEDGKGLQQCLPISFNSRGNQSERFRLSVRNYLEELPETGQVIISCGRLKELIAAKE